MAEMLKLINEIFAKRDNGTISITNSRLSKQFLQLLIKEEFVEVQKVAYNKYKIKKVMVNNIVVVDRRPMKAKSVLEFASEVLPSITGAVVISTNKGLMTHREAASINAGGRILAVIY